MNIDIILKLKYPNASIKLNGDIELSDNGDGNIYISKWNLLDQKPTQKDLEQWAVELELEYKQQLAIEARKAALPPIEEQLDMLYNDKINNTNKWVEKRIEIDNLYPIPDKIEISQISTKRVK